MHSTERGFLLVERNVALHPSWMEAVSSGFPLAPAPGEESAFVLQPLRLDNKRAFQLGLDEPHESKQLAVSCEQLAVQCEKNISLFLNLARFASLRENLPASFLSHHAHVVNPERFFDSKRPPHIR